MSTKLVTCPTCKGSALYDSNNLSRPFCSSRCQLGDLAAWATDNYIIAGATMNPATLEYSIDASNDDDVEF